MLKRRRGLIGNMYTKGGGMDVKDVIYGSGCVILILTFALFIIDKL